MSSMLKATAISFALMGLASLAEAQAIDSVTMTSDPDDVVFTLRADKTLPTPSIRTYEGQVRVRFPESNAPSSIQVAGDGSAIKSVDVRSGSHDSAVMRLDLGDNTKLSAEDVRVEDRKHVVVLRIARDLLPPMREPRSAQSAEKKVAEAAPALAAQKVEAPVKLAGAPLKPSTLVKSKQQKSLATAMATQGGASSPMPMLIAISAILALAYAAIKIVMKKQTKQGKVGSIAPIDIVAQKRIGPRHQLVIVRAFGREHLLSIQGGTTTPIATSDDVIEESPSLAMDRPALSERREPTSSQRLEASKPRSDAPKKEEETAFGSELIRVALAQRLKEHSKAHPEAEQIDVETSGDKTLSKAVAGLVKLRRQAGMQ